MLQSFRLSSSLEAASPEAASPKAQSLEAQSLEAASPEAQSLEASSSQKVKSSVTKKPWRLRTVAQAVRFATRWKEDKFRRKCFWEWSEETPFYVESADGGIEPFSSQMLYDRRKYAVREANKALLAKWSQAKRS